MEDGLLRDHIKALIIDGRYRAYIALPKQERDTLYALCVKYSEIDWLYNKALIDKIVAYVFTETTDHAVGLAKSIKNALADYYETHLEEMFEECLKAYEHNRKEECGLKANIDAINGEITWSK